MAFQWHFWWLARSLLTLTRHYIMFIHALMYFVGHTRYSASYKSDSKFIQ